VYGVWCMMYGIWCMVYAVCFYASTHRSLQAGNNGLINHCYTVCTLINHCYTVCTLINHCCTVRCRQAIADCRERERERGEREEREEREESEL
jgi:hypothetical protein